MHIKNLPLLLLPLLGALPVQAMEMAFGLQGNVAMPIGSFGDTNHLDRRAGFGLGVQAPMDFGDGHVLRPRLDYLSMRRNSDDIFYRTDSWLFMAEYNGHLSGYKEGVFLIGGLGLHHTRRDASRPLNGASSVCQDATTGLAYDLGVGYAFNRNLALDVKYLGLSMGEMTYSKVGRTALYETAFSAGTVMVSLGYTF
jgi:opacity protein-like surface antigen